MHFMMLAKRLVKPLNQFKSETQDFYHVSLKRMKGMLMYYFNLKCQAKIELSIKIFQSLWQEVFSEVLPILKDSYRLIQIAQLPKYWNLRRAIEQLQWQGYRLFEQLYSEFFENTFPTSPIYALHVYQVGCFDKNKPQVMQPYLDLICGNSSDIS